VLTVKGGVEMPENRDNQRGEQGRGQESIAEERQTSTPGQLLSTDNVRGIISILLVLGFVVTILIVILIDAGGSDIEADTLQNVASIYAGVTGAVLGYFFGRGQT
jgi:hypothetical protein